MAVLDFEPRGLPPSFARSFTQKFRAAMNQPQSITVLSDQLSRNVLVFYKDSTDYRSCQTLPCALDIGGKLGVDYLVTGLLESAETENSLNLRVFSMDLGLWVDSSQISVTGEIDSLIKQAELTAVELASELALKPKSFLTAGPGLLPQRESFYSMLMGPRITAAANARGLNQPIIIHGPVPGVGLVEYLITNGKLRAALYSSAIPGAGQLYSRKKWSAMSFFTTELTVSILSFYHHQSYKKAYEEAEKFFALYEDEDLPELLPGYKEQVLEHVETLKFHNRRLQNYRDIGRVIWLINIAHAYYVGPETIYSKRPPRTNVNISYNPVSNRPELNLSFSLD